MKLQPRLWVMTAMVALLGCAGSAPRSGDAAAKLANGFYAVLGESEIEASADSAAGTAAHVLLPYDHIYTDTPDEPRVWLALSPSPYVPLVLTGPPDIGVSEKGFASLSIALAPENTKLLEDFTREHLNGPVAIVVGGEVVTKHKIKSVITGGKMQITRCTDNACEVLRTKLLEQP